MMRKNGKWLRNKQKRSVKELLKRPPVQFSQNIASHALKPYTAYFKPLLTSAISVVRKSSKKTAGNIRASTT